MKHRTTPKLMHLLLLTTFLLILPTGCGGEKSYVPDPSQLPVDTAQQANYPEGPYGKSVGSVVENYSFDLAFYDPLMLCKEGVEHSLAASKGTRKLSLLDLFRGNSLCEEKPIQLAWMAITAGW